MYKEISVNGIKKNLKTFKIGTYMETFNTIDSTNIYLKNKGYTFKEGSVVISEHQTNGVGTKNKTFYSPFGEGIYLSILIKPNILAQEVKFITVISCLAVKNAVTNICCFIPKIKWVNDLFYNNKKFCGILTESKVSDNLDFVVVGIGINTGEVAEEVAQTATSIYTITGTKICRNLLIAEILNEFEKLYTRFLNFKDINNLISQYIESQFIINMPIYAAHKNQNFHAEVIGLDNDLNIILKKNCGEILKFNCEEINIKL